METKLLQLAQHRFTVSSLGNTVEIKGVLFAGAGFERFSDIFSKAEKISLESVVFASWAGIEDFLTFLGKFEKPFQLDNIRETFFEAFVLQMSNCPSLSIGAFSLSGASSQVNDKLRQSLEKLNHQTRETNLGELEAIERVFSGSFCHVMLHYSRIHALDGLHPLLDELSRRSANIQFLYMCFLNAVVKTTNNQIQTIACSSLRSVMQILDRVEGIERGLSLLGLPAKFLIDRAAILSQQEAEFSSLSVLLNNVREDLASWLNRSKSEAYGGKPLVPAVDLTKESERLNALLVTFRNFASRADEVGVSVSCAMMPYACGSEIAQQIDPIDTCSAGEDQLESLSSHFYVVDAFAAGSWQTLKPEIKTELDILDSMVMNMSIELQGFDAAKQVIEKRVVEIQFFIDSLNKNAGVLNEDFEREFIEIIAKKLVTVQERKTFGAYLSRYKNIDQELIETQEVSFFL